MAKAFSSALDDATVGSAQFAYQRLKDKYKDQKWGDKCRIPFRPVVLGGDDLTMICRADLALEFTQLFMEEFEKRTSKNDPVFKPFVEKARLEGLSACAGIAFIKSSYPFYFGYNLAEALCGEAKRVAKGGDYTPDKFVESCVMFHKVQDSFVEDYKSICKRMLMPNENYSFEYGPYYLKPTANGITIDRLLEMSEELSAGDDTMVKSHIRQWISMLYHDEGSAEQKLNRLRAVGGKKYEKLIENLTEKRDDNAIVAYDVLAINTIYNQETNTDKP